MIHFDTVNFANDLKESKYKLFLSTTVVEGELNDCIFINCDVHLQPKNEFDTVLFFGCVFVECVFIGFNNNFSFTDCSFHGECHFVANEKNVKMASLGQFFNCKFTHYALIDETIISLLHQKTLLKKATIAKDELNKKHDLSISKRFDVKENFPFSVCFISGLGIDEALEMLKEYNFEILETYEDEDQSVGINYTSVIHVKMKGL